MTDPATLLLFALIGLTGLALLSGFPVAFSLAGASLIIAGIASLFGIDMLIENLPGRLYGGILTNSTLTAIPIFIFMGLVLERSRIAEDLLLTAASCLRRLPGGAAVSVMLVGTLLAASTGIVGATVVAMALISLPVLLRQGYSPALAGGTICAAGTLGQIIPPSIILVLLGDRLSIAYQTAQSGLQQRAWADGDTSFIPNSVSVGDLFAGSLFPGLVLVALYILYLMLWAPRPSGSSDALLPLSGRQILRSFLPPVLLISAVLGSILGGIAPPTEAAGLGALGAVLLAAGRVAPAAITPRPFPSVAKAAFGFVLGGLGSAAASVGTPAFSYAPLVGAISGCLLPFAISQFSFPRDFLARILRPRRPAYNAALICGVFLILAGNLRLVIPSGILVPVQILLTLVLSWGAFLAFRHLWQAGILGEVNRRTLDMTAMIFAIVIGAAVFSLVFRSLGGDAAVEHLLHALGSGSGAVLGVLAVMFLLGFVLDVVEIILIVVPIAAPALLLVPEVDPVWLGVMMAMVLQTAFLTPPFGLALFYLRGAQPDAIKTTELYRGIVPFVVLQLLALAILWFLPGLAVWLPKFIYG